MLEGRKKEIQADVEPEALVSFIVSQGVTLTFIIIKGEVAEEICLHSLNSEVQVLVWTSQEALTMTASQFAQCGSVPKLCGISRHNKFAPKKKE